MLVASVPALDFQNPKAKDQAPILPLVFEVWQITVSSTVIWLLQFKQLFIERLAQETVNIVHFKIHNHTREKSLNKQGCLCPQNGQTTLPTW